MSIKAYIPESEFISHSVVLDSLLKFIYFLSDSLDSMDCSPPGSSVHGILQTRILEWVAISSSRGSSQRRDQTRASCLAGRFFTTESPGKLLWVVKLGKGYLGAPMGLWSGSLRPWHLPQRNVSSAHWLCPAAPTWSGSRGWGGALRISTPEFCPRQALRPWELKPRASGTQQPQKPQDVCLRGLALF